jgi:hypothetical protein
MDGELAELLPADYLAAYQAERPEPVLHGPLDDLVTHHYSSGGCFTLAAALHLTTGFPIELYVRNDLARHAYVSTGRDALDVVGLRPLEAARAGAERSPQLHTLPELVAVLRGLPTAALLLADLRRPASQVAAERTAAALLRAVGMSAR